MPPDGPPFDDACVTGAEQEALAAEHADNPLLQVRGNAGTHDLALGTRVLTELKRGTAGCLIPRYDKAARGGKGDRAPRGEWAPAPAADVVLLEGWMAGFTPIPAEQIAADPALSQGSGLTTVNGRLGAYAEWHDLMDAWAVLAVDDVACVYEWRLQARPSPSSTLGLPSSPSLGPPSSPSAGLPPHLCRRSARWRRRGGQA